LARRVVKRPIRSPKHADDTAIVVRLPALVFIIGTLLHLVVTSAQQAIKLEGPGSDTPGN
jgi:hypothetical protein